MIIVCRSFIFFFGHLETRNETCYLRWIIPFFCSKQHHRCVVMVQGYLKKEMMHHLWSMWSMHTCNCIHFNADGDFHAGRFKLNNLLQWKLLSIHENKTVFHWLLRRWFKISHSLIDQDSDFGWRVRLSIVMINPLIRSFFISKGQRSIVSLWLRPNYMRLKLYKNSNEKNKRYFIISASIFHSKRFSNE